MRDPTTVRPRLRDTKAAKLGIAVAVFATVIVGWTYGSYAYRMHTPLPGLDGRPAEPCTLWFVGSSTTARWNTLPQAMAPWKVRRRGVSGAMLAEIEQRFTRDGDVPAPVAIILYGGENDLAAGHTPEQTAASARGILAEAARRYPHVPRYVVGLKPSPKRWAQRPAQLRYDALVRALLTQPGTTGRFIADGRQLLGTDGTPDPRFYVADGLHLSEAGYAAWGSALRRNMEADMSADLKRRCLPLPNGKPA